MNVSFVLTFLVLGDIKFTLVTDGIIMDASSMLPPMAVSRAVFCCENYVIILIEFYLLFFLLSVKNPSASWALARAAVVTSWLWNHDAIAHVSFRLEQQDQVHRYVSVSLLVQPACFALNFISKQTC